MPVPLKKNALVFAFALASAETSTSEASGAEPRSPWGPRLSAFYVATPGIGGNTANLAAGNSVGADLSIPVIEPFRYRFALGYERLGPSNGIRLEPLGAAATFELPSPVRGFRFAVEPSVSLLHAETFFDVGGSGNAVLFLSSGIDVGLSIGTGRFVLVANPFGVEARYFTWIPAALVQQVEIGWNVRTRIAVGFEY